MHDVNTNAQRADVIADFARSELFGRTFQEGMDLVEESAGYLDGAGRQESKSLSRNAALSYAAESMRLTTRLMKVASWLLVQRAVREGDMPALNACEERYRLAAEDMAPGRNIPDDMPAGLKALLERSERLFERVRHLDRRMYVDQTVTDATNPVAGHLDRLRSAFGG